MKQRGPTSGYIGGEDVRAGISEDMEEKIVTQTTSPLIVGIDPGVTGAIAVIDGQGKLLEVIDCEAIEQAKKGRRRLDLHHFAWTIKQISADWIMPALIVLEVQQSMHKQGVASTFTTGYGYGGMLGILTALDQPYCVVRPNDWKVFFRLGSASKAQSREMVMARFPGQADQFKRVKDHNRAEAVLIALWGLKNNGQPKEYVRI